MLIVKHKYKYFSIESYHCGLLLEIVSYTEVEIDVLGDIR